MSVNQRQLGGEAPSDDIGEDMELITIKELQRRLEIGNDKAYELVHMPNFPSRKIKGQWRTDWGMIKRDFRDAPRELKDLAQLWR